MSHNGYLKLYQLRKPKLDIDYDVILLDEAQDTNPAIQDIVMRQKCARVVVGDRHQAIYSFIGAEDTLRKVQATRTFINRFGFTFERKLLRKCISLYAKCIQKCVHDVAQKHRRRLNGHARASAATRNVYTCVCLSAVLFPITRLII